MPISVLVHIPDEKRVGRRETSFNRHRSRKMTFHPQHFQFLYDNQAVKLGMDRKKTQAGLITCVQRFGGLLNRSSAIFLHRISNKQG